jgi:multidrug efflux pump subunit AcrA (membrane-fusion protein)
MKVLLKVQESWKPRLDEKQRLRALVKILGVGRPVGATLSKVSVLPDNSQRWWNPDLREYPVELTLDETPAGLKPGMRVENAEIFVNRLDQVIAVPLAAIYTVGNDSYVFVRDGQTVKERKVVLGTANETHVQVVSGLNENEQVLLLQPGQGRMLLEKAGIKVVEQPTTRPAKNRRQRNLDQQDGPPRGNREPQSPQVQGEKDQKGGKSEPVREAAVPVKPI